jgi:hypothetical protein
MAKKFEKKAVGKPEVDDFADMAEPAAVAVEAEEVPAEVEPVAVTEKNYVVAPGRAIAAASCVLGPGAPISLIHFGGDQAAMDKHIAFGHIIKEA